MPIDPTVFQQQYDRFKERMGSQGRPPFVSFREGFAAKWEGYKEALRLKAIGRLDVKLMREVDVGDGAILDRLVSAIEIPDGPDVEGNNLVGWVQKHGPQSVSHRALLDARGNPVATREIEAWVFRFFRTVMAPGDAFEALRDIVGSRYDLLAYLFFLRDWDQYMPIAPRTFDTAFKELGIGLVTERQCSWTNYEHYNDALRDIQAALREASGIGDIRLVDAHSFCWLLVRPEVDRADAPKQANVKAKSSVKIYDARAKSIWLMADTVVSTVKYANGQQVMVTKKSKELWMGDGEISAYIAKLLDEQKNRCKLTGIPLQFHGEQTDHQLAPSLDRIDSNGHYAVGNLQVVCKFINMWKSDTANDEFMRLLSLVRHDEI